MLLRDRHIAALPAVADRAQRRQDGVPQHRLAAEVGEEAIECGVGGGLVEREQGIEQRSLSRFRDGLFLRAGKPRRLGRRDSTLEVLHHSANAPLVPVRVETEAPFRPLRLDQAVAALPGAKERRVDAGATGEFADAVPGRHAGIVQIVDRSLTTRAYGHYTLDIT